MIYHICLVLSIFFIGNSEQTTDKVVCYYGSWATYRPNFGKFDIEDLDPKLCSHVIYSFVGLEQDGSIKVLDPYNDLVENYGKGSYNRLNKIKSQYPHLKTLIAIGGWNEGSIKYSQVVASDEIRLNFVRNVVNFTNFHGFNGFDVDWEYPNQRGGRIEDVDNFVKLLKELRREFDKFGLILSLAVAATQESALKSYNIPEISKYVDLINVMTYDLHGPWDKVTGQNSPLYPSSKDVTYFQKQLNVVACINFWLSKGTDPNKILLGIATFGHSFTLNDPNNNGVGSPANNGGNPGSYTRQSGVLGYNEIVELQNQGGWIVKWDDEQKVPFMFKNGQWIGYDNPTSVELKVNFAKSKKLGGVMIWSIETDDFLGFSGTKFPILHSINSALNRNITISTTTTISNNKIPSTTKKPEINQNESVCKKEGYVRDPKNCSKFYYCIFIYNKLQALPFNCASFLKFDENTFACDYPENVNC